MLNADKLRETIKKQLKYWDINPENNTVKYTPKGNVDNEFYDKFLDLMTDSWITTKWYMGKKEIKSLDVEDFVREVGEEIMKTPEILTKIEESL
jgi:hypothetical protein